MNLNEIQETASRIIKSRETDGPEPNAEGDISFKPKLELIESADLL